MNSPPLTAADLARLARNLADVRERIDRAARLGGRSGDDVTLVAVTKYVGTAVAAALLDGGCTDLGESRPQELWNKAAALEGRQARWHLIGHLQRNKAARTVPLTTLIHSCDSLRLLQALEEAASGGQRPVDVLLEINISGDQAKHGLTGQEADGLLQWFAEPSRVALRGLMGMAGLDADPDEARRQFASLGELRDRLQAAAPPAVRLSELSMGMSGGFEIAVEVGATIVRVGSALFEGLTPQT